MIRIGGAEVAPWAAFGKFTHQDPRVVTVVSGDALPAVPATRRNLGQTWAGARFDNISYGVTVKVPLTRSLAFRGGLGHADGDREKYFSEIICWRPLAIWSAIG